MLIFLFFTELGSLVWYQCLLYPRYRENKEIWQKKADEWHAFEKLSEEVGLSSNLIDLTDEDFKFLLEKAAKLDDTTKKQITACIYWIKKNNEANYFDLSEGKKRRIGTNVQLRADIYSIAYVY